MEYEPDVARASVRAELAAIKVEFQCKPPGSARPLDYVQDEELIFEKDEYVPIPNVGDTVHYLEGGKTVARKVLTRHFSYLRDLCMVNIVVVDVSGEEMATRLKA
jgi:hypothetical protein